MIRGLIQVETQVDKTVENYTVAQQLHYMPKYKEILLKIDIVILL